MKCEYCRRRVWWFQDKRRVKNVLWHEKCFIEFEQIFPHLLHSDYMILNKRPIIIKPKRRLKK